MRLKKIRLKNYVPRIIINPHNCFTEEEFNRKKNLLSKETNTNIVKYFDHLVIEVVSVSVENDKLYMECIGTLDEHFVTAIPFRRNNE